jgi:hypothetical protein
MTYLDFKPEMVVVAKVKKPKEKKPVKYLFLIVNTHIVNGKVTQCWIKLIGVKMKKEKFIRARANQITQQIANPAEYFAGMKFKKIV